jgi:hypothetical protein
MLMQQTIEREQATLAVILRPQHQNGIFDRDNDGDRPDHQRNAAEHRLRRWRRAGPAEEQLIHGVERRRPDIAVNDAQRTYGQRGKTAARFMRGWFDAGQRSDDSRFGEQPWNPLGRRYIKRQNFKAKSKLN